MFDSLSKIQKVKMNSRILPIFIAPKLKRYVFCSFSHISRYVKQLYLEKFAGNNPKQTLLLNYDFNTPRLRCQTESRYVQTVPDGKCLSPDPPRRKVPMSRLSCVQNFSCVHRAFKTPYVQTFVRSKSYMTRL